MNRVDADGLQHVLGHVVSVSYTPSTLPTKREVSTLVFAGPENKQHVVWATTIQHYRLYTVTDGCITTQ